MSSLQMKTPARVKRLKRIFPVSKESEESTEFWKTFGEIFIDT